MLCMAYVTFTSTGTRYQECIHASLTTTVRAPEDLTVCSLCINRPSRDSGLTLSFFYPASNKNLDLLFDRLGHNKAGATRVLIATGFIARTPDGIPTTLKRNGSDYSATIFGALLIAANISIWTDGDGVYSADPRKVKEAVCLKQLSYNEAWELSYFGANVLHPRTTLPAMRYSIPVTLRNYFNQAAPGTSISDNCAVKTNGDARPVSSVVRISQSPHSSD